MSAIEGYLGRTLPASPSALTIPHRRSFSSSVDVGRDRRSPKKGKAKPRTWTLLYHRPPGRSVLPRAMIGTSSMSILYWTWYVADFIPTVNGSAESLFAAGRIDAEALELMTVDTTIGLVGLGLSTMFLTGSISYIRHLVSAVWKSSDDDGEEEVEGSSESLLAVSTLRLPFATQPALLKKITFDPESNPFDSERDVLFGDEELKSAGSDITIFRQGELTLVGDKDVKDILGKFGGDFGRKKGHLALQRTSKDGGYEGNTSGIAFMFPNKNWLLDIGSGAEIMRDASPHLLRSLVLREQPYQFGVGGGGRGGALAKDDGTDEKEEEGQSVADTFDYEKYVSKRKGAQKKSRR